MLVLAGVFFVICAASYNVPLVSFVAGALGGALGRTTGPTVSAPSVYRAQLTYASFATALFLLAFATQRIGALSRTGERPFAQKMVLMMLALIVPLATLEVAARPFVPGLGKQTSLFMRDDALGWRMRPGAVDQWGGITVRVNEDGLRGPLMDKAKGEGTRRVLYLGDSVTFGYRVKRHEDTFPFIADSLVSVSRDFPVETVNAGVGGYSPWQQTIFLQREGIHYAPDLVVVGFVLNDVTEKFALEKYGGSGMGYQLRESYYSRWDQLVSRSAFAQVVRRAARVIKARRRFGDDPQLGATKQQALDVETLIRHPEQENVAVAWRVTLQNVREIFDYCHERRTPALLVIFPFAMQLASPDSLSSPQQTLTAYADTHGIASLDVLPALHAYMTEAGATAEDIFIDEDHLTVLGHRIVADVIAKRIETLIE